MFLPKLAWVLALSMHQKNDNYWIVYVFLRFSQPKQKKNETEKKHKQTKDPTFFASLPPLRLLSPSRWMVFGPGWPWASRVQLALWSALDEGLGGWELGPVSEKFFGFFLGFCCFVVVFIVVFGGFEGFYSDFNGFSDVLLAFIVVVWVFLLWFS